MEGNAWDTVFDDWTNRRSELTSIRDLARHLQSPNNIVPKRVVNMLNQMSDRYLDGIYNALGALNDACAGLVTVPTPEKRILDRLTRAMRHVSDDLGQGEFFSQYGRANDPRTAWRFAVLGAVFRLVRAMLAEDYREARRALAEISDLLRQQPQVCRAIER